MQSHRGFTPLRNPDGRQYRWVPSCQRDPEDPRRDPLRL